MITSCNKIKFLSIDGVIKECSTAKASVWPLGEIWLTKAEVLVLLAFDLLCGNSGWNFMEFHSERLWFARDTNRI